MLSPLIKKKEFVEKAKQYFENAIDKNRPQTLPGLAEHFACDVDDLVNYPADGPLADVVKFAKLKCHNWLVNAMLDGRVDKGTGQLMLKNHFEYTDKIEAKHTGKINISKILDEIEKEAISSK